MLKQWKSNGELHLILSKIEETNRIIIPIRISVEEKFNIYIGHFKEELLLLLKSKE
jgi:hypothetical protein